jgi:hypothetical protein
MKTESQEKKVPTESPKQFDTIEKGLEKNLDSLKKFLESIKFDNPDVKIRNLAILYTVDDPRIIPAVKFSSDYMKFGDQTVGATEVDLYQMICSLKQDLETGMLLRMMKGPMEGLGAKIVENVLKNVLGNVQITIKNELNQFLTQVFSQDKNLADFFAKAKLVEPKKPG